MSTLLRSECLQCLTESQLRSIPQEAGEEQKLAFYRACLRFYPKRQRKFAHR